MRCVKTGGWAYLHQYDEFVYGDMFRTSTEVFVMRVCERRFRSDPELAGGLVIHARVVRIEEWFDKDDMKRVRNSTLISSLVESYDTGVNSKEVL